MYFQSLNSTKNNSAGGKTQGKRNRTFLTRNKGAKMKINEQNIVPYTP